VIKFIERYLYVPEGPHVGKPLKLFDWQKRELERIYDNPHGTRRAIISTPRKNAKSSLTACLLTAHLCGPPARLNSQLYSAAQSRDQAGLIFNYATKMIRMSPVLSRAVTIRESAKELVCPALGTRYKALSAEASTAMGLNPVFVIFDELGQVRGPRSALYEALETATGAQVNPLVVIISTQARSDNDLLSILIDDALTGSDPRTVISLYTAPLELDPFAEDTIRLANPAYGTFLNPIEVLDMARAAQRMPARQSEYESLVLNRRIESTDPFVAPGVWKACSAPVDSLEGVPVYGGLDLSEVADLTALVLIGKREGKWHVRPTFWLPSEGLRERAQQDHVPYDMWVEHGHLETTPGKTVSYEFVAEYLARLFARYDIRKLAFDMWNFRHLKPWLARAGFSDDTIKERFLEFGQGVKSMSPALRDLEEVLLGGQLVHGDHPVLSMCMANLAIVADHAGNRKPSKRRSSGRIDGAVALLMALGAAPLQTKEIDIEALIA
jgi:phage terminase large subunit-like protein